MTKRIGGVLLVAVLVAAGCSSSSAVKPQEATPPVPAKDKPGKPAESPNPM